MMRTYETVNLKKDIMPSKMPMDLSCKNGWKTDRATIR